MDDATVAGAADEALLRHGELGRVMRGLLDTVDVPMTPPRVLKSGAPVGLELLDLILQPLHVRRITERLNARGITHLERSIIVDVSVSRLTASQMRSAHLYSNFRSTYSSPLSPGRDRSVPRKKARKAAMRSTDASAQETVDKGTGPRLWLPILRMGRQETAPAEVTDGTGNRVPRASQSEIAPLLTAALTQLFRQESIRLRESVDATKRELLTTVRYERENARWLIFKVVEIVVRNGLAAFRYQDLSGHHQRGQERQTRDLAKEALGYVLDGGVFGTLLDLASTSQFVVVGIERDASDQSFMISMPRLQVDGGVVARKTLSASVPRLSFFLGRLLRPRTRRVDMEMVFGRVRWKTFRAVALQWRRAKFELKCYQTLTLRYVTPIPETSTSYHLHISTEDDLTIENALLVSDDQSPQLDDLANRAAKQATALQNLHDSTSLQANVIGALSVDLLMGAEQSATALLEILEDRMRRLRAVWETLVDEQPFDLERIHDQVRALRGELRNEVDIIRPELANATVEGARTKVQHVSRLVGRLQALLVRCSELQIGQALTSDDDPEESEAHVHRRERRRSPRGSAVRPETATVLVAIRENTPALRGRVLMTVGPLAFIVYVIGCFLYGNPLWLVWPSSLHEHDRQAGALITVLLLVPGLLIARLDIARGSSLLAVIRSLPRVTAFGSVAATTLLAATIASGAGGSWLRGIMSSTFLALVLFFLIQLADVQATRWASSRRLNLDLPSTPAWLMRPGIAARPETELDIDIRSDAEKMGDLWPEK